MLWLYWSKIHSFIEHSLISKYSLLPFGCKKNKPFLFYDLKCKWGIIAELLPHVHSKSDTLFVPPYIWIRPPPCVFARFYPQENILTQINIQSYYCYLVLRWKLITSYNNVENFKYPFFSQKRWHYFANVSK